MAYGRLAQLVRASRLQRVCRGFESLTAHYLIWYWPVYEQVLSLLANLGGDRRVLVEQRGGHRLFFAKPHGVHSPRFGIG